MNTEGRVRKALRDLADGVNPDPMPDRPREHAWHWGTIIDNEQRHRVPPRFPAWRDIVMAVVTGLLLGSAITFAVIRGSWPPAGVIGLLFLAGHGVVLGLGQYHDQTRLTPPQLKRIAAVYGLAMLVAAAIAIVAIN